jgi:CDI toxin RNase A-like protein
LLRQPIDQVVSGDVDLALHEGPGHTISRHVGRTTEQLMARIRREKLPRASTYWNEQVAQKAINETLQANGAKIREWLATDPEKPLQIRHLSNDDVGFTVTRRQRIILTRRVVVILKRVDGQLKLITSYPDPRS